MKFESFLQERKITFPTTKKILVIFGLVFISIAFQAQATDELKSPYYHVIDNKVDKSTFTGWQIFHLNCYTCHNVDAIGSDVAPDLLERVKPMSPDTFAIKVLKRYRISMGMEGATAETGTMLRDAIINEMLRQERGKRGEIIMPAWEDLNPDIKPHIMDLYAYLKARSDGALGPGKPELIQD